MQSQNITTEESEHSEEEAEEQGSDSTSSPESEAGSESLVSYTSEGGSRWVDTKTRAQKRREKAKVKAAKAKEQAGQPIQKTRPLNRIPEPLVKTTKPPKAGESSHKTSKSFMAVEVQYRPRQSKPDQPGFIRSQQARGPRHIKCQDPHSQEKISEEEEVYEDLVQEENFENNVLIHI